MNSKIEKNSCHSERYATTARQLRSCVSESESKEMLKRVQHDNFVELGELIEQTDLRNSDIQKMT